MKITHGETDGVTVVRLEGNLDTGTSAGAQKYVSDLIDGGASKILLDFSGVGFVSSAGLRVLLTIAKDLKKIGGSFRIFALNGTVKEVFEITGFDKILEVRSSEADAMAGF